MKTEAIVLGLALMTGGAVGQKSHYRRHKGSTTYHKLSEYTCPTGYTLQGKACIGISEEPAIPVCKLGTLQGNRCVVMSAMSKKCPAGYSRSGKECIRYIDVPLVPQCPKGLTLVGNQCEKVVYVDPVCPSGYSDEAKQCVRYDAMQKKCPPGFNMSGKNCIRVNQIPEVPQCSKGYELVNDHCEKTIFLDPVCPSGYSDEGKQCVRYDAMQKRCPPGFNMSGKKCIHVNNIPKVPVCDKGYELVNDRCEKTIYLDPVCPSGTTDSGKNCARFTAVQKDCPQGYRSVGKKCVQTNSVPKNPECPKGLILVNDECQKTIYVNPICPPGYVEEGKRCVKEEPMQFECPEGFNRVGKNCLRITPVDLVPTCSKGYSLVKNTCELVVPGQIRPICKSGRLVGNNCEHDVMSSPELSCPKGYELSGSRCVKDMEYDCSTKTYRTVCDSAEKSSHLRSLGPHYRGKQSSNPHSASSKKEIPEPAPICRQVPEVHPKTCNKQLTADPIPVCPPGTSSSGKQCTSVESEPAETICVNGESVANCNRVLNKNPDMICPLGDDHKECSIRDEANLIPFCANFEMIGERCLEFTEKVCPGGKCDRIVTSPANWYCPDGYESSDKNSCIAHSYAEYDISCPKGYILENNRCVAYAEKVCPGGKCDRLMTVASRLVCPLGEDNVACTTTDEAEFIHFCRNGFENHNGRCAQFADKVCPGGKCDRIITTPYEMVCPLGDMNKGTCSTTDEAELIHFCRNGFENHNDRCAQFADKVCPGGKCDRVVRSPAQFVCPLGVSSKGCKRSEQSEFDYFCPKGLDQCGHQCCSYSNPELECQKGGYLSKGVCKKNVTTSPIVSYVTECKGDKC